MKVLASERRPTPQMRLVALVHGEPVSALLRRMRGEGLSAGDIARAIDVPYGTVHHWLVVVGLDDDTLIRQALSDGREGAA